MRVQVLTFNDESDEDVLGRIVITHAEVSGTLKSVTITGEVETVQGGSRPVGWLPRVGNPIVGTWRLTSFTEENLETGAVSYPFGVAARAFVIYEVNGYVATMFSAGDRKPPAAAQATEQEAIQLYRSMIAFSGRYELVGNRLIYRPEISWNEAWNGTTQERVFEVKGDRLEVKSVPAVSTLTGARTVFSLAWQRVT